MPKSWYRIGNQSAESAELYIDDEIGMWGVTSKAFTADLRALNASTIKLHLNSPGGSVDDGIAIFNALKSYNGTVEVFVDALAASAASFIAMAGDRIVMAPHSRMMIHEAQAVGKGNAADFEKMVQRLRDSTKNIASIYNERSNKGVDHWLEAMAAETWYSDQEAVDAGLADEVGRDTNVQAFRVAASFNLSRFRNAAAFAETLATVEPEKNQGNCTIASCLASGLYEAATSSVEDWIECQAVTVSEAAAITTAVTDSIQQLEQALMRMGVADRAVEEDDTEDIPMMMAEKTKEVVIETRTESPRDAARRELEIALARVEL